MSYFLPRLTEGQIAKWKSLLDQVCGVISGSLLAMVWHGGVDISGCSHDQPWVSHIIGECLPGWQWGLERLTSAGDLDLLASSSCLRVTTLANSLESCCCCSWYPTSRTYIHHPPARYPLVSVYFSDVHIVCTTLHLTVPHPPTSPTYSDINAYLRTGILVAKVKLRRLLSKPHWISTAPLLLWTHSKFYFPLFDPVFCNWDAACPVISVQWSHVQCPHPHEVNTNSPGQPLANKKTALPVHGPIRAGESMEMLGCPEHILTAQ